MVSVFELKEQPKLVDAQGEEDEDGRRERRERITNFYYSYKNGYT